MPEPRDVPPRVTLPLLELIQRQSLDEDYLIAAERRAERAAADGTEVTAGPDGGVRRTGHPRRVAAVVVAVFGIMASTAAVQTQRNASVADEGRATLTARIEDQRDRLGRLQERIASLRQGNASREQGVLGVEEEQQVLATRLRRLEIRTGFSAVRGPGVSVIVRDEPTGSIDGVVQDEDLALLVNGLWAAGAEAISINGQRLTAMSAIRLSGVAIEVNGRGIAPPFTVLAIGDPRTLHARFYDTSSGLLFNDRSRAFGFEFDLQNEERVSLPAGPGYLTVLRSAVEGRAADQRPTKTEELE